MYYLHTPPELGYFSPFIEEENETQKGHRTCPSSQSLNGRATAQTLTYRHHPLHTTLSSLLGPRTSTIEDGFLAPTVGLGPTSTHVLDPGMMSRNWASADSSFPKSAAIRRFFIPLVSAWAFIWQTFPEHFVGAGPRAVLLLKSS